MTLTREGGSTTTSCVLDGSSYAYWKVRMIALIESIDNKTWKVVISGWTHPFITNAEGKESPKPEKDWFEAKDEASLGIRPN